MDYKDYYAILGVPRDADEQAIKSAYRRLARQYHPDVNPDKATATEKFKEINEAYTVLSDPEKRRRYDAFSARYQAYGRPGYGSAPGGAGYAPPRQQTTGARGYGPRPSAATLSDDEIEQLLRAFMAAFASSPGSGRSANADAFSDFFEFLFGGRPATARPSPAVRRWMGPRHAEVTLFVTLEEALHGSARTVRTSDGLEVQVQVPPGVTSGTRLRLRGLGPRDFFGSRGDLYLTVQEQPHPLFQRRGDDLWVTISADAEEVRRQGEVKVPTLEQPVVLKVPEGTRSGQVFRLRGLGMPRLHDADHRGDLYVALELRQPAARSHRASPTPRRRSRRRLSDLAQALRRLAGVALASVGFLGVAVQTSLGRTDEWLIAAALATFPLLLAVVRRSVWWATAGAILTGVALWLGLRADLGWSDLPQRFWPLLPLVVGLLLLSPAFRRPR